MANKILIITSMLFFLLILSGFHSNRGRTFSPPNSIANNVREVVYSYDNWDIMGLKLGMSMADANILIKKIFPDYQLTNIDSDIATFRGIYGVGKYRHKGKFSIKAKSLDHKEEIILFLDPTSGNHEVIAIERKTKFESNQPSLSSIKKVITEKYGKIDITDNSQPNLSIYTWAPTMLNSTFYKLKENIRLREGGRCTNIGLQIGRAYPNDNVTINYGSMQWSGEEINPYCGVILRVIIKHTNEIVHQMKIEYIDSKNTRKAYDRIGKIMAEGEQKMIQNERKAADEVNVKF